MALVTRRRRNEKKYSQNSVDDIDIDEDGPPEHLWSQIAPSTEDNRTRSVIEGSETLTGRYKRRC